MKHVFHAAVALFCINIAAAQTLSSSTSPHLVSGVIIAIDKSILTLKTKTGTAKVDDALAMKNERVGAPLTIGLPITVQGSMIEGNGALQATSIGRAKGTDGQLWPPDR